MIVFDRLRFPEHCKVVVVGVAAGLRQHARAHREDAARTCPTQCVVTSSLGSRQRALLRGVSRRSADAQRLLCSTGVRRAARAAAVRRSRSDNRRRG